MLLLLLPQGTLLASFREESKARLKVLQKLGHVSADGTVLLKGRAACEIDTADELLTVGKGWAKVQLMILTVACS